MPLLEVADLEVRYGPLVAARRINVVLDRGHVCVVLGANGAGKSSVLNAICGAIPVARGHISLDGTDVTRWPAHRVMRQGLALVPEGRHIIAQLTVEENLLLGAYIVRSRRLRRARLDATYDLFPRLYERRTGAGGLLSGGEQQMLAIGRALMSGPRMLLLDEPSMGLAPLLVDAVMNTVSEVAARGITVLMVEQNVVAAMSVATHGYVMEQGEIVLAGSADELRENPRVADAFLGTSGTETT